MRTVYPLGTTIYDPDRCQNGYTLVHASNISLVDMNGNTVHKWDFDLGRSPKLLDKGNLVFCEMMAPAAPYGAGQILLPDSADGTASASSEGDEWRQGNVREYDWDGELVWEHLVGGKSKAGTVAERLANGNTLFMYEEPLREEHIAHFHGPRKNWADLGYVIADSLLEVTSDGEVVWGHVP